MPRKKEFKAYTTKLLPTHIEFLRKKINASQYLRELLSKEIIEEKKKTERPSEKVIRLRQEIVSVSNKIYNLKKEYAFKSREWLEKAREFYTIKKAGPFELKKAAEQALDQFEEIRADTVKQQNWTIERNPGLYFVVFFCKANKVGVAICTARTGPVTGIMKAKTVEFEISSLPIYNQKEFLLPYFQQALTKLLEEYQEDITIFNAYKKELELLEKQRNQLKSEMLSIEL